MSLLLVSALLLAPLQQGAPSLDDALARAAEMAPAGVLALADEQAYVADDEVFAAAAAALPGAEGRGLLFLVRLLAFGDEPSGGPRLVGLLDPEHLELSLAALKTLRLDAFKLDEEVQAALGMWLQDLVAGDAPVLWTEGQLTLFRIGDSTRRSAALRNLRAVLYAEDEQLARRAALTLGRTGAPMGLGEIEKLESIAQGIGEEAMLAESLLDRQAQQQRFREKIETLQKFYMSEESGPSSAGAWKVMTDVMRFIQNRHMEGDRFDREELIGAAADGMLRRLDPHSNFLSGEEFGEFTFDMDPSYGGIGAYVDTVDEVFTILRPIYSGPAYEAGLLSGDKVLSVDGWSTNDQPNDEIISRLKGKPGTNVRLEVFRRGWTEPREFLIERARIEIPVLQQEMLPGRVLYLELVGFSADVAQRVDDAVSAAQREGELHGVVLDLRNNPGGYLDEAVELCDVFLPRNALVVTTKSRSQADRDYHTRFPARVSEDIPLAVLINEYSASASEIVSGALAVHGRAVTVGERTHGKGSVQQIYPIDRDEPFVDENRNGIRDPWEEFTDLDGDGEHDYAPRVKLTVAYYFLPDGSSIHTQRDDEGRVIAPGGVQPEVIVGFPEQDYATLRELEALLEKEAFRTYARTVHDEHPELAVELAENDGRDPSRYPGWDEFYASLNTHLDEQEVRRWVRRRLRNMVSDERGKTFPGSGFFGDFLEDPQLQAAIREILERAQLTAEDVPEYAGVLNS